MDAEHLRGFLVLADTRNLERAAKLTFLTVTDLTILLDEVEAETQSCFFVRSSDGQLQLTVDGVAFRHRAEATLRIIEKIFRELSANWRTSTRDSKEDRSP